MSTDKYAFNEDNVNKSPDVQGIYQLYDGDTLIYIGRADGKTVTIRSRLQAHLRGDEGPCTQSATTYSRYEHSNPKAEEIRLLDAFKARWGRLPRCNSRVG